MQTGSGAGLAPDVRQLRAQLKALESDLAREREAERELRLRLDQMFEVAEATPDAVVVADAEGKIRYWNRAAETLFGYRKEEALNSPVTIIAPPPAVERTLERFQRLRAGKPIADAGKPFATLGLRKDGVQFPAEGILLQAEDEHGPLLAAIVRDATKQRETEAALTRSNRALQRSLALSQALAVAENEHDLLDAVCRFLVEEGYHAAWIGKVERHKDTGMRILRIAGHGPGDTKDVLADFTEAPRGSATAAAVRSGKTFLVKDVERDARNTKLRDNAVRYGIRSAVILPLIAEGSVVGNLSVYASQTNAFDAEEVKHLEAFASGLCSGLSSLRERATRRKAEETVRFRNTTLEAVYAVDRATAENLDMATVIERGVDAIMKALGVDGVGVSLVQPDGKTRVLVHQRGVTAAPGKDAPPLELTEGVSGRAVAEKRPIVIDVEQYPGSRLTKAVHEAGIKTIASAPLLSSDRVLGTLTLNFKQRRAFTEGETDLLKSIGIQLGAAIHRAQLAQDLRRRLATLEAVYAVDKATAENLELATVLQRGVEAVAKALNADMAAVGLLMPDGKTIATVAHTGLPPALAEAARGLTTEESVSGVAAREKRPVIVAIQDYPKNRTSKALEEAGIKTLASAPLLSGDRVLGSVTLNFRRAIPPDQAETDLLKSIGIQLGGAVERAQLAEGVVRRNRTLEAVYAVDRATADLLDLAQVLEVGLDAILKALDVETGAVYLLDPDGQTMTMAVHRGVGPDQLKRSRQLRADEGISGQAMKDKLAVVLDAADYPTVRAWDWVTKLGYQTLASAPLLASGHVLGAITLATARPHAFPQTRRELLTSIGIQLGGAVHRAQLHQQTEQRIKELSALNNLFQQQIAASGRVKEAQRRFVDGMEKLAKETASFALEAQRWSPKDAHLQLVQRLAAFTKTLQGLSEELRQAAAQTDELHG